MTAPLVRSILFPTDLSDCAEDAFSHAAFLADRFDATLHVLHVREDPGFPPSDWADSLQITVEDVAEDLGMPLAPEADPLDLIDIEHAEVEASDVASAILHHASGVEADLIVMGTHGRSGLERAVVGSVAESVLRHARCPVFTVGPAPGGVPWALRRVLVAVQETEPMPPQARWAAVLARAYGARIDLLRVVAPSLLAPGASGPARRASHDLRLIEEALVASGVEHVVSRVREGDPAGAILEVAREIGADLIAMGTHGREGVRRAVLGSVCESVVRRAPCPVFVAPGVAAPVLTA